MPLENDLRRFLFVQCADEGPQLSCLTAEQLTPKIKSPGVRYRVSPIFPAIPSEGKVPGYTGNYLIGFFFFEDPFFVLGELLTKVPKSNQKGLWFSHGLASTIYFADDISEFEVIKATDTPRLCAYEIWRIEGTKIRVEKAEITGGKPIEKQKLVLETPVALDSETEIVIEELRHCLNTAVTRASQFLPSSLTTLTRLYPAVNDVISDLNKLAKQGIGKSRVVSSTAGGGFSVPELAEEKLRQQLTDHLVQVSSALSYVVSQAYSGIVPILEHECQIRNYSLLGIGTAHNGLAALTEFCELTFQRYPVDTVVKQEFKKAPGFTFEYKPGEIPSDWKDPRFNVDAYIRDVPPQISKLNLGYFSGRLGFRETQFTITAPLQTLTHSATARWSLMTLTHELMHAHVRSILSVIFPLRGGNPEITFQEWYREFAESRKTLKPIPTSLLETVRFVILNYCLLKPGIDDGASRIPGTPSKDKIQTAVRMPDATHLASRLQAFYREINEIFVHVLDFNYFFDCREEPYLMLLWESWSPVPTVIDNVDEYLLRSLVAISSRYSGNSLTRYEQAAEKLRSVLERLQSHSESSPLIGHALGRLQDSNLKKQLLTKFSLAIYLADMVQHCLVSKHIHAALYVDENRVKRDLSHFYALETGDFAAKKIESPVAFVSDLLRRELEGNSSSVSQRYTSAWLFLVCASAPIERENYVSP